MAEAFDDAFLELLNPTVQDEDGNVVVSDITRPVYQVPGTEVWLNYSMMPGNPIVQNDSVAFAFEGTFLDGELPWAQPLLPLASDGSAVSLAISEYTANSAAKAFFRENGLFLIQYPGLSPDTVNSLFPNFTADFGAAKVPIDISPAEAPVLSITQANTSASLRLLFALENPLNPAEDAIRVFATAALVLAPGMSPKTQHIVADILSLDVSVDSVECLYEETEVALADVEAMLAPAFDFFRKNLDADYLSVGVPLPAPVLGGNGPLPLGQLLAGATLTAMDGYYLVEAGARLRSEVI